MTFDEDGTGSAHVDERSVLDETEKSLRRSTNNPPRAIQAVDECGRQGKRVIPVTVLAVQLACVTAQTRL